jgi:hypothetical protein
MEIPKLQRTLAQEKAGRGISIVNGGTHVQKSGARAPFLLAPRK